MRYLSRAVVCFCIASPFASSAQTAAHDVLRETWEIFIGHCTGFVENPVSVRDALSVSANTVEFAGTPDGKIIHHVDELRSGEMAAAFYFEEFEDRLDGHCTVSGYSNSLNVTGASLASSFTGMLVATPGLTFGGGQPFDHVANAISDGYDYIIDGAFPGRNAKLYVTFADDYYDFEVYVSYPKGSERK